MAKKDLAHLVSVYGPGITGPLLKTTDARLIQIRDAEGELMSLFFRITDNLWGFVSKGDSDWEDHKKRLEIDDSPL